MIAWIFLLLQLTLAGFFLFLCLAFVTGGPFVPSRKSSVAAMISLSEIKPGMKVTDMGSGDGRVLFAAARAGASATGYEINPYLVWYTRIASVVNGTGPRIRVFWKNLWKADVSDTDVIFVYLIPWRMEDLSAKLKQEAKRGTLVVSNSFMFPGWKLVRGDTEHHVYAYRL